jgi:hypothetical protein
MIGVYDFCGHYEWTFEWLRREGGEALVRQYWDEAIHRDSQRHAAALIVPGGIEGMKQYWGHTLAEEAAEFQPTAADQVYRFDMYQCPSKGFLLANGLEQYHDYCDHCIGWLGPLMRRAGWTIDHEHNHRGQCWWEMHRADEPPDAPATALDAATATRDVRRRPEWNPPGTHLDSYRRATGPADKQGPAAGMAPPNGGPTGGQSQADTGSRTRP